MGFHQSDDWHSETVLRSKDGENVATDLYCIRCLNRFCRSRGLCKLCYDGFKRAVNRGEITWEILECNGSVLKKQRKGAVSKRLFRYADKPQRRDPSPSGEQGGRLAALKT